MKRKEEKIFQTDRLCRNKTCELRLKQKCIKFLITKWKGDPYKQKVDR